jgi:isoleucyl-tRNA synthetase
VHSYPHCWRTDKPILYYPLDLGLSKFQKLKTECSTKRNHQLEAKSNWKGFGNWLKNANDWNLSRSDLGIPLPIWRTEDNQEEIC